MKFKAIVVGQSANIAKYEKDGKQNSINVGGVRLERINEGVAPRHGHGEIGLSGDDPAIFAADGITLGSIVEVEIRLPQAQ